MGSEIDAGHPFDLLLKHWRWFRTLLPVSVRFRIIGLPLKRNLQLAQRLSRKSVAKVGNLHGTCPYGVMLINLYAIRSQLEPK